MFVFSFCVYHPASNNISSILWLLLNPEATHADLTGLYHDMEPVNDVSFSLDVYKKKYKTKTVRYTKINVYTFFRTLGCRKVPRVWFATYMASSVLEKILLRYENVPLIWFRTFHVMICKQNTCVFVRPKCQTCAC